MLKAEDVEKLTEEPGVYLFKNAAGEVIYVGKAKSLKKRVAQYLRLGGDGRPRMPYLQAEIEHFDVIVVRSEPEALLLENNLIKHHYPKYNVLLKDDKSFMAIKLDRLASWPRLETMRYRAQKEPSKDVFGPYSAVACRELVQFVEENFGLRRCSDHEFHNRTRPCLLYGMKRCLAPCVGKCSKEEYQEIVGEVYQFLSGKSQKLLDHVDLKIQQASDKLEFEQAARWLELKKRLSEMSVKQAVDLLHEGNSELLHLEWDAKGTEYARMALARVSVRGGKVLEVTTELLEGGVEEEEGELLLSLAIQAMSQLNLQAKMIQELFIDLEPLKCELLQESLRQMGFRVMVRAPKRAPATEWKAMAIRNACHRLSTTSFEKSERYRQLGELKQQLGLEALPIWIECIDTSHQSGKQHVASLVAFQEGLPMKKLYRHYRVEEAKGDDYAAMRQVLSKRFERATKEGKWPDLILLDGGEGHLNLAVEMLHTCDLVTIELASLSKEKSKHTKGLNVEWIHRPGKVARPIDPREGVFHLIQRIRDEAHRFAINYHRERRSKEMTRSVLDDIPGIGPKKKKQLLLHFGSVAKLKGASVEELKNLAILNESDRKRLIEFLNIGQSSFDNE